MISNLKTIDFFLQAICYHSILHVFKLKVANTLNPHVFGQYIGCGDLMLLHLDNAVTILLYGQPRVKGLANALMQVNCHVSYKYIYHWWKP